MRNKRMFCLDVVDTDFFLEMPSSSQALYFHLGMRADDNGFVSSPKRITNMVNCGDDDFKLLIAKGYLIPFESGVVVIRHWKQNNYIRPDRFNETKMKDELKMLECIDGIYTVKSENLQIGIPVGNHVVDTMSTTCHTQKKETEEKKKKEDKYSVHFEVFWNAYPRKKEKARAYKQYCTRIKDGFLEEELLTAAIEYAKECKSRGTEEKYIKHAATFLGANTPFTDYLEKGADNVGEQNIEDRRPAADYYRQLLGNGGNN